MNADIIIRIRDGMVTVATDKASNPLNAIVHDYDVKGIIPEDALLTDEEGDQYVAYEV